MEFAQLLLSEDFVNTHHYAQWAGLFPFLYGGEVEEVAAREAPSSIIDKEYS